MTDLGLAAPDRRKQVIAALRTPWSLTLGVLLLVAVFDTAATGAVAEAAVGSLLGTLPYILIAAGLVGYLKASGAESVIAKAFEGREARMILLAALFGGLAPFCSCQVIPFIAALLALGAPLSAVMAFWLASPLIDPASLLITAAALGWDFAIAKMILAVALGVAGGFAMLGLMTAGAFPDPLKPYGRGGCGCGPSPFSGKPQWRIWSDSGRMEQFRAEALSNIRFMLTWLSLAYMLEAVMVRYVPADTVGTLVGGEGILPIAFGALVGMPAYLNSYAAPPLVAGLMQQGMSAGAGMAFMMAGAVSCIPAMAAVYSLVRLPVFATYVALGLGGAIMGGVIYAVA